MDGNVPNVMECGMKMVNIRVCTCGYWTSSQKSYDKHCKQHWSNKKKKTKFSETTTTKRNPK